MMEEGPPKLVDYFVLAGLTPSSKPLEDENLPRLARPAEPITDVAVIIRSLGEDVPHGFTCIERTPGGHSADLGTSLLTNQQLYLCYRRGRDRMPITELGIYYEGKESLKPELQILETTPYSHSANLSSGVPGHPRTFLTFKRAPESLGLNTLGVMDICIINPSKGESTPHTFCRVDRNLNTSMFGPALFLCYKKAMAKTHSLVYEAGVISRFPETDSDLFPFPELVPMFCLPMGATIESWSLKAKYHLPVFSTFVLTGASGDKVSQSFLCPPIGRKSGGGLNFALTCHLHPQMSPYDNVLLCQPVSSPLPLSGASYVTLLQNLGPENAVTLLLSVLTEHKLLIHSQRPDVLTSVAEALVSIIFPLRWQCPYIPLCPLTLADVLCAPVPFIVGIHSSYFDLHDPPQDVLCVDLDTNTLFQSEEKKMLPRKPCNVLRNCLSDLHKQLDEMYNKPMEEASLEFLLKDYDLIYGRRTQLELDVRASFLRFMSCLFKGYRSYLLPITQAPSERTRDSSNLFNVEGFKKSRDRAHQKFYSQLVKTQMFTQFIEDCSFVNERHASLEFFDNCVEKVQVDGEKMEDLHLVELDESHRSEHTVFIMPAEEPMDPHGIEPPAQYKYETFPILQRDLFELPQDLLMAPPAQSKTSAPSSPAPRRTKQVSERTMIGLSTCSCDPPIPPQQVLIIVALAFFFFFLFFQFHCFFPGCSKHSDCPLMFFRILCEGFYCILLTSLLQVCYRILMQLCGQYGEPVLAVRVMLEMRKAGIVPNAITYGYYNKAVLESKWPSKSQSGRLRWAKLRNVVLGAAQFRQPLRERQPSSWSEMRSEEASVNWSKGERSIAVLFILGTPHMSSCSVCPACHSLIYDEDIMAAWTSDDSNLKTVCSFCGQHFVPFLNVKITDLQRQRSASDVSTDGAAMSHGPVLSDRYQCLVLDDEESRGQCNGFPKVQHRPSDVDSEMVTVAYLCPLVLRKEVESLLENEGSEFLSQPELVNSHPIIYWNLVWYFQRLALPSNLPQLILASKHVCHPTQIPENPHVSVRLLWDILVQDPDRWPPMYVLWKLHRNLPTHLQGWRSHSHPFTLEFLEKVLNFIGLFEVHKAINLILTVLQEQNSPPQILQRGIYREMLLLTLAALGREHMDIAAFDSKYKTACKKLGNSMGKEELRKRRALLPGAKALDCRKTFGSTLEC
ncbi:DENN domain-containing protein 4B [Pyxicephalus adspersus]|uniref:DENN domain-containing protein 4B n=1 Tax=Pyxicephalus adspersus TaxID=30357 RepID=UPI003B5C12C4